MQLIYPIVFSLAMIAALANLALELKRDLMMLQQNSYRNDRYARWRETSHDSTSMPRLTGMAVVLASLSIYAAPVIGMVLMLAFGAAQSSYLASAHYKKPLVFTPRACRLYATALSIAAIVAAIIVFIVYFSGSDHCRSYEMLAFACAAALTAEYCGSHIIMVAANILLNPVERNINRRYYNEARDMLRSMPSLKIIGITGSYGKTSTKHYLTTILSEQFETLMTPGSYNTTLGVVRTVRERLKPYTEVFVVEMGAKQRGDIKEICDLVHPHMGIITAVGEQHLESFGSIENIQSTKFELADALPSDGVAVVNNDFAMIASRDVSNTRVLRYAVEPSDNIDAYCSDIHTDASGTRFRINFGDRSIDISTRLVGRCNISNLVAAVAIAINMGMSDEAIRRGAARIEQVEHRLSIKRTHSGIVILDDAFNSNPVGSGMALEVLSSFNDGKRIVVTPGMIELGQRQYDENFKFGQKIAGTATTAIIVGEYNREAIIKGIQSVDPSFELHTADTFTEAQAILGSLASAGDCVLYENDLPDTFK